jgi:hypothetical protein
MDDSLNLVVELAVDVELGAVRTPQHHVHLRSSLDTDTSTRPYLHETYRRTHLQGRHAFVFGGYIAAEALEHEQLLEDRELAGQCILKPRGDLGRRC